MQNTDFCEENMSKVMVAMSGGVDSSVTAYMLLNEGHTCCGCTMKLYDTDEIEDCSSCDSKTCCALSDIEDARSVAYRLGMKHHVFNFKDEFREHVIDPFVESYLHGETPNPCINCNMYLKFDKLINRANTLGYDDIATGHYARIELVNGKYVLKKAIDLSKDQSYVLYSLTQDQLAHIHFPLGELTKTEVREIAEANQFVNAKKHDSQDICFVPDGDYAAMIERYLKVNDKIITKLLETDSLVALKPGNFVDSEGNVLGPHKGIMHYTIGQRRGLGIPAADRLYVVGFDMDKNTVLLGSNDDLFSNTVYVKNFHWIEGGSVPATFRCSAKIRYRHKEQPCTVNYEGDGLATIVFDEPQRAITPGQTAVLYSDDVVLGGGVIYSRKI